MKKRKTYRPRADGGQVSAWAGGGAAFVSTERTTNDIINSNTAEEILRRFGPDPDPNPEYSDMKFWESACEEMLKEEAKWQQLHRTFAWINKKPDWVPATAWETIAELAEPPKPCTRQ